MLNKRTFHFPRERAQIFPFAMFRDQTLPLASIMKDAALVAKQVMSQMGKNNVATVNKAKADWEPEGKWKGDADFERKLESRNLVAQ